MLPLSNLMDTVFGHNIQKQYLLNLLNKNLVPHAMLFSGPSGVGKRTLARAFAASLLLQNKNQEASKHSDRLVASGNHPDLIFVNAKQEKREIYVDDVRGLCSKLALKPYSSEYIIAIIDQADLMNIAACNALLKTLEEPSQHCKIILISSSSHKLPETILSRCQPFFFGELDKSDLEMLIGLITKELSLSEDTRNALLSIIINDTCSGHVELTSNSGSLETLQLDEYVDTRTLKMIEYKKAKRHLEELSDTYKRYVKLFTSLTDLESDNAPSASYPIHLASELSKETDNHVQWRTLYMIIRRKLIQAN